jgi:hypothetical protein
VPAVQNTCRLNTREKGASERIWSALRAAPRFAKPPVSRGGNSACPKLFGYSYLNRVRSDQTFAHLLGELPDNLYEVFAWSG